MANEVDTRPPVGDRPQLVQIACTRAPTPAHPGSSTSSSSALTAVPPRSRDEGEAGAGLSLGGVQRDADDSGGVSSKSRWCDEREAQDPGLRLADLHAEGTLSVGVE